MELFLFPTKCALQITDMCRLGSHREPLLKMSHNFRGKSYNTD